MWKKSLVVLSITLFPTISAADPNETIKSLMNDPATMLDIGLLKISQSFKGKSDEFRVSVDEPADSFREKTIHWGGGAEYNWDDNKVEITGFVDITTVERITSRETAQKNCKLFLDRLSDRFHSYNKHNREFVLDQYFSHYGFVKGTSPENLGEEMADLIRFYVRVQYTHHSPASEHKESVPNDGFRMSVTCFRSMTDNRVYFSE